MDWITIVAVAVVVVAAVAAVVYRTVTASRQAPGKKMPDKAELEADIARLESEIEDAKGRDDSEAVEELTLQLRVKRHWLHKIEDGSWKEYYEQTKGRALDEWGKTGSK